jgi:nitroreductase
MALTHVLEKSLARIDFETGHSLENAELLMQCLFEYIERKHSKTAFIQISLGVLEQYLERQDPSVLSEYRALLREHIDKHASCDISTEGVIATEKLSKEEYLSNAKSDFSSMAQTRKSVRDFSSSPVSVAQLKEAIRVAQHSPSACNRQPCRVYIVSDPQQIPNHLSYHHAQQKLSSSIDKLLVITTDISAYDGSHERNQAYIDGGLFCMSLQYALQYSGLGSVCLNWNCSPKTDQRYRKDHDIPSSELIIMMMATGHLPEQWTSPKSTRKDLDDIVHLFDDGKP